MLRVQKGHAPTRTKRMCYAYTEHLLGVGAYLSGLLAMMLGYDARRTKSALDNPF